MPPNCPACLIYALPLPAQVSDRLRTPEEGEHIVQAGTHNHSRSRVGSPVPISQAMEVRLQIHLPVPSSVEETL